MLPPILSRVDRHRTPYWSVVVYLAAAALIIVAAAGEEQELVLFCAVAVFVSFLVGLVAMARFAHREDRRGPAWADSVAASAVGFTLVVNLMRGRPVPSLAVTVLIASALHARSARPGWWVRAAGRVAVAAVVVGLVVVAVSGRDGGRDRPVHPPATAPHAQETD